MCGPLEAGTTLAQRTTRLLRRESISTKRFAWWVGRLRVTCDDLLASVNATSGKLPGDYESEDFLLQRLGFSNLVRFGTGLYDLVQARQPI